VVVCNRYAGGFDSHTKFPFRDSRELLASALEGRNIHVTCPALFDRVITEIRPYRGGDDTLCALHDLDILDKHKLLLPVITYGGAMNVTVQDEHGNVGKGNSIRAYRAESFHVNFRPGVSVKDNGQLALSVIFGDGMPLEGIDIEEVLTGFPHLVAKVINQLQEFG
jgi:hypothetical protein